MKTHTLQEVIPLSEIVASLHTFLPEANLAQLRNAFVRFWNAAQEPEWVYYSKQEALDTIEAMKREFLEDLQGEPEETFAGRIARETGLELVGEPKQIQRAKWG